MQIEVLLAQEAGRQQGRLKYVKEEVKIYQLRIGKHLDETKKSLAKKERSLDEREKELDVSSVYLEQRRKEVEVEKTVEQ